MNGPQHQTGLQGNFLLNTRFRTINAQLVISNLPLGLTF